MTTRVADLATVLAELGVDIKRQSGDEINGRCPVHHKTKGRESGGYSWYINADSGLWHCFTCGARGNLGMLVSELSGSPDALWQVQQHLITTGLRRLTAEEEEYEKEPEIDWVTYAQFKPLPQRIVNRRSFDPEVATRFGVKFDPAQNATVTPIVSPMGELRGWQLKKTGWVKNQPFLVNKSTTLFGIERAFSDTALLVESPLDVVRFHSVYGGADINCLSSFGANVSDEQLRLLYSKFTRLIMAMDNDKAGRAETKRLAPSIQSFRDGVRYWKYTPDDPKDIGDMYDGQIIRGLSNVSRVR